MKKITNYSNRFKRGKTQSIAVLPIIPSIKKHLALEGKTMKILQA